MGGGRSIGARGDYRSSAGRGGAHHHGLSRSGAGCDRGAGFGVRLFERQAAGNAAPHLRARRRWRSATSVCRSQPQISHALVFDSVLCGGSLGVGDHGEFCLECDAVGGRTAVLLRRGVRRSDQIGFHTPWFSILFYAVAVWGLAIMGSFAWNVTLSVVARLFYYAAVCAAVIRSDFTRPGFRFCSMRWQFGGWRSWGVLPGM